MQIIMLTQIYVLELCAYYYLYWERLLSRLSMRWCVVYSHSKRAKKDTTKSERITNDKYRISALWKSVNAPIYTVLFPPPPRISLSLLLFSCLVSTSMRVLFNGLFQTRCTHGRFYHSFALLSKHIGNGKTRYDATNRQNRRDRKSVNWLAYD